MSEVVMMYIVYHKPSSVIGMDPNLHIHEKSCIFIISGIFPDCNMYTCPHSLFLFLPLPPGQMMMSAGPRGPVTQNPGMPQVSSVMEDEILMDLIWGFRLLFLLLKTEEVQKMGSEFWLLSLFTGFCPEDENQSFDLNSCIFYAFTFA